MKKLKLIQLVLASVLWVGFASSCAYIEKNYGDTYKKSPGHVVTVQMDGMVSSASDSVPHPVKKGESFTVDKEPVYVEAPGHIGVIVLPAGETPAKVDLSLRQMSGWASEGSKQYASKRINDVLKDITHAQSYMYIGENERALTEIRKLKATYPDITYLSFLEASALTLLNRKAEAKLMLERGLASNPDDENAKALLKTLSSGGQ